MLVNNALKKLFGLFCSLFVLTSHRNNIRWYQCKGIRFRILQFNPALPQPASYCTFQSTLVASLEAKSPLPLGFFHDRSASPSRATDRVVQFVVTGLLLRFRKIITKSLSSRFTNGTRVFHWVLQDIWAACTNAVLIFKLANGAGIAVGDVVGAIIPHDRGINCCR